MTTVLVMLAGAVLGLACTAVQLRIRGRREAATMLADLHTAERAAMLAWLAHCYLPAALAALESSGRLDGPAVGATAFLDVRVSSPSLAAARPAHGADHEQLLAV